MHYPQRNGEAGPIVFDGSGKELRRPFPQNFHSVYEYSFVKCIWLINTSQEVKGPTAGMVKATGWGVPTQGSNTRCDTIYVVVYPSTFSLQKKHQPWVLFSHNKSTPATWHQLVTNIFLSQQINNSQPNKTSPTNPTHTMTINVPQERNNSYNRISTIVQNGGRKQIANSYVFHWGDQVYKQNVYKYLSRYTNGTSFNSSSWINILILCQNFLIAKRIIPNNDYQLGICPCIAMGMKNSNQIIVWKITKILQTHKILRTHKIRTR